MIDQNRDGFVDKDDLIEMMTSLGKNPADELLDAMVQEASGPINFTMFLTLFGDKLSGTDPEDVIVNAFACFDDKHSGTALCSSNRAPVNGGGRGRNSLPYLDSIPCSFSLICDPQELTAPSACWQLCLCSLKYSSTKNATSRRHCSCRASV